MSLRSLSLAFVLFASLPALAEEEVIVALAPIAVHAAGEDSTYLSRGLSEMLSARLQQFDGIRVIPIEAGKDDALAAARSAGADYVLFGSFTRFGEGASLDLQCMATAEGAGESRRVFIQAGLVSDIIPKLDTLAEKVARFSISGEVSRRRATTDGAAGTAGLADLTRRVEALEERVYAPASGTTASE